MYCYVLCHSFSLTSAKRFVWTASIETTQTAGWMKKQMDIIHIISARIKLAHTETLKKKAEIIFFFNCDCTALSHTVCACNCGDIFCPELQLFFGAT